MLREMIDFFTELLKEVKYSLQISTHVSYIVYNLGILGVA